MYKLRVPSNEFGTSEYVDIDTNKAPTKEEILEALRKNSINNLEELVNALMPETGGYKWHDRDDDPPGLEVAKLKTGSINVHWHSGPGVFDPFVINTGNTFVNLEDIDMATQKPSTKEQIMEALKKNKITTLEQFVETLMPSETGGFVFGVSGMAEEMTLGLNFLAKVQKGAQGLWLSEEAQELKDNPVINDEIF